ncbi:unknown [Firmicutes bacterium CAG:555]|nr:unknown [Firmicutes bacterium CAG:555]
MLPVFWARICVPLSRYLLVGAYRVCSCVIYRKNFAPCVVGVGYDELAGGCISQCHHITLNIVQVIVEIITSVGHTDTVALLVVEEAQGLDFVNIEKHPISYFKYYTILV